MSSGRKIGVLTLHSGFNEGSILQAFCLSKNMQKTFSDSTVQIIDHRYPSKMKAYGPVRDVRTKVLDEFMNNSLPLSREQFVSESHVATFNHIEKNYDALITGSDELWKLKYSRRCFGLVAEQNDPWCPAFPNVYWPDENIKIPKIAYAASIGQTDWRTIPRKHIKRMKRILSNYTLLGIRDQRTMSFLEWLAPDLTSKAEWVPDPTFSIDILSFVDRVILKQKLQKLGIDFSRPRICTVLDNSLPIDEMVVKEVKKRGIQIVALTFPNSIADVQLFDKGLTPLEWAASFGLMDFCISQRMHSSISCILNSTPFMVVDSFYTNPMDDDTKIKDLMRSFNLLDYYFNAKTDTPERFRTVCENLFNNPWPVGEIGQKRLLFNNRSKEFTEKIRDILKG